MLAFRVERPATDGGWEKVDVQWRDLLPTEREEYIARLRSKRKPIVGSVITLGLLAAGGTWFWGNPAHTVDRDMRIKRGMERAAAHYNDLSFRERYEMTYVNPMQFTEQGKEGGTRLRKWTTDSTKTVFAVGQSCLKGSSFDTTRVVKVPKTPKAGDSDGVERIVATFASNKEGTMARVYPGGSDAAPLEFVIKGTALVPSPITAQTLELNGCTHGPDLVVSTHDFFNETVPKKKDTLSLSVG